METTVEKKDYELFKRLVVENAVLQAEAEADLFSEIINLASIQPCLFFSHDGVKELIHSFNTREIFRDYILNVTSKTLFEFQALGGNYSELMHMLIDTVRKMSYMETISESITQSMFIGEEDLLSLLSSDIYVMISYFIVLHEKEILPKIKEKFD